MEHYEPLVLSGGARWAISLFAVLGLLAQTPDLPTDGTALVEFSTEPSGSSLLIDGKQVRGRTPIALNLAPGASTITFVPQSEGYKRETVVYSWQPHETRRVHVNLRMAIGTFRVTTDRPLRNVELDGRKTPTRPNSPQRVQAGRHTILAFDGRYAGMAKFRVTDEGSVSVGLVWRKVSPDPTSFALIAAHNAKIGSPDFANLNPPRSVNIAAFWIEHNEITVREYAECVRSQYCAPPDQGEGCNWGLKGREDHPVNCVSAIQAESYARWFSSKDEFAYRLPTAFEWETTATAGGTRDYPWGSGPVGGRCNICDLTCSWIWRDASANDAWAQTAPVGHLKNCAGPELVYDLIGNVAEWCLIKGTNHYDLRGGSWASPRTLYDPRSPNLNDSRFRDGTTGFRLAASAVDLTTQNK